MAVQSQPLTWPLTGLLTGAVRPLGARGAPSGIAKSRLQDAVALTTLGLAGDAQGDTKRHGGPEKALHHYPLDHYAFWTDAIGDRDVLQGPGAFGENLSTLGLTEADVAIGDVFALGSAVIEVSQGRQPCWKLNDRFANPAMARLVQTTGRTGWYYRVLQEGMVSPDDSLRRLDRPAPEWTLHRIWRLFYFDPLNRDELAALAALPRLAESWRQHARKRLDTNRIEDWTLRLTGSDPA